MSGPLASFIAEMFPTRLRYTGSSIDYQASSTIGAGSTPMIAAGTMAATAGGVILGAGWISILATGAIGVLITSEGRNRELSFPQLTRLENRDGR